MLFNVVVTYYDYIYTYMCIQPTRSVQKSRYHRCLSQTLLEHNRFIQRNNIMYNTRICSRPFAAHLLYRMIIILYVRLNIYHYSLANMPIITIVKPVDFLSDKKKKIKIYRYNMYNICYTLYT